MKKNLLAKYIADDNSSSNELSKFKTQIFSPTPFFRSNSIKLENLEESSSSFYVKDEESFDEKDLKLHEIQCELNVQGASDLVIDLFINDSSNKIFKENVLLAIALLEGGNTQVQVKRAFFFSFKFLENKMLKRNINL
jgi:hypothetical protein